MDAGLIVNPVAGKRAQNSVGLIQELLGHQAVVTTCISGKPGESESFARDLAGSDLLVIAGGDGTINEVINGLMTDTASIPEKRLPRLGIVPIGTANVLAHELGIPASITDAVRVIFSGSCKNISLGRINGKYFSLMAGIGFDGETVRGVKMKMKRVFGKGAYLLSGVARLIGYTHPAIEMKTENGTVCGTTAIIGNARSYGGAYQVTPLATLTEPLLDLCLFQGRRRMDILRYVLGIIRKKHLGYHDVHYEKFSAMEISSPGTVPIQVDGDYFGTLPARIEVARRTVNIFC